FMKNGLKTDITRFMKRLLALGAITTTMFAAGCKGPDDPKEQLPTISSGELLVRLSGNEHKRDVSVDAHTWGLNDTERATLKAELKAAFLDLELREMERLADNKIMEFGIIKDLDNWYTGFVSGSEENGKHVSYFPPEDIDRLLNIINGGRLDIQDPNVILPNIPNDWVNGVPPSNAGRSARLYNAAQER
ncbi:MAG: hypothetical protein FWE09_05185, partial [Treponema sp.]|nr:hypothetical protein [Treponema sp.]